MGGLLALAFGAGMLAPVNPCGFAVLPAFLAYAVGQGSDTDGVPGGPVLARLGGGLRAGALTLGFTGTFTVVGALLAVGLRSLMGVVPWLAVLLGVILALLGIAMLIGWQLNLRLPSRRAGTPRQGPMGMVAFGAGYALASASCTLAVLLAVVTQALATSTVVGVLVVFAAYAAGSATLLLVLAVFAAFASGVISRYVRRLLPYMNRITGAVLALSGGYLLLYWLPQLIGDRRSGSGPLTGVVGAVSSWVTGNQVRIAVIAVALIAAAALAAVVTRRRDPEPVDDGGAPGGDDCCSRDQPAGQAGTERGQG